MADVIDDLELLVSRAINYFTQILYDLCRRLNENSHRPFNRRSLIRWIAVFMPAPKRHKLRLQSVMAGQAAVERWGSCGSLASTYSATTMPFVEEDLGDNIVRYRRGYGDDEFDEEIFEEPMFLPCHQSDYLAMTSTPKMPGPLSISSNASGDIVAKEKLVEMEEELAALRKQIAMLVMAQESMPFKKLSSGSEVVCSKPESFCPTKKSISSYTVPVPPPPPLPLAISKRSCENTAYTEPLQQRKIDNSSRDDIRTVCGITNQTSSNNNTTGTRTTQQDRNGMPDMVTVLKDLRNVKLKAIERSPGGTPMRLYPEREPTDPSAIIALALKKKFSTHWCISSDSDKENDSSSFTSDFSNSFGQPKIKRAKKKLNMYDSSDSLTPVVSPLHVEAL